MKLKVSINLSFILRTSFFENNPCFNSSSSSSSSSSPPSSLLSSSTSLQYVKVELQPLILSILDDPGVSRVFADARFRSHNMKMVWILPERGSADERGWVADSGETECWRSLGYQFNQFKRPFHNGQAQDERQISKFHENWAKNVLVLPQQLH